MKDFEELYNRYAAEVYRLCRRAVSRPEVAEELTSDVFLLYRQNQHAVTADMLPGWLFTVAKRRAADYWRHQYVEQRWSAAQPEPASPAPEPEFSLERLLERCPALKPEHRLCLILRYRHDLSRAEIAARTGLSEFQVKGNLQYALRLLREYLGRARAARAARGGLDA